MDFRRLILDRLKELEWTKYRLHQEVKGEIAQSTLYEYLRGEYDIHGSKIAAIFTAVGLTVVKKRK